MDRFILNFDMDDTWVSTKSTLLRLSYMRAVELGNKTLASIFKEAVRTRKDITELSKEAQDFVEKEVIAKRTYMDIAGPSDMLLRPGLHNYCDWLESLTCKYGDALQINICTHRGDNDQAWRSTYNWLVKHSLYRFITRIHSIDHTTDKLEYLNTWYKGEHILLVDDNPFGSSKQIRKTDDSVLIYNGHRKLPSQTNQRLYKSTECIANIIKTKLGY